MELGSKGNEKEEAIGHLKLGVKTKWNDNWEEKRIGLRFCKLKRIFVEQ